MEAWNNNSEQYTSGYDDDYDISDDVLPFFFIMPFRYVPYGARFRVWQMAKQQRNMTNEASDGLNDDKKSVRLLDKFLA